MMHERAVVHDRPEYAEATVAWIEGAVKKPGIRSCWNDAERIFSSWGYDEFVDEVDSRIR
jgi:hypothetical protein